MCAIRQEVSSIQAALLAVGEDAFRHIATLAIASELNAGQPAEILRMAFVRGRFCELAAAGCALDPTEQYLLGMLSLLPAMMRLPMEELAPALPLRNEIREALQGQRQSRTHPAPMAGVPRAGRLGRVRCDHPEKWAEQEEIYRCYAEAVVWAEEALQSAV
jgi:c-di-GMP-related signal transduction protein